MEERLQALLDLAVRMKASDIHLTGRGEDMKIEMRIGGVMREVKTEAGDQRLIPYLQYLAGLDVGALSKPQTGQFEAEAGGQLLSLRFALISSLGFSSGVLRILNNELVTDAAHLSLVKSQNDHFKSLLRERNGLILFSGATGSGKTTALYALLKEAKGKKIYTVEDPIEIYREELVQLQINEAIGFHYSEAIKQVLRHDPDILMIGEIRDEKAAFGALRAANTGHLVLSSIHASSAALCISRMCELGVPEGALYDVLKTVSCQSLEVLKNGRKAVFYEIMDGKELAYYRRYHRHSVSFLSLDTQLKAAREGGHLA